MSLRRSSRRSSGGGADGGDGQKFVVGAVAEVAKARRGARQDVSTSKDNSTFSSKPKRLFVGDSVEFCSNFAGTKTAALESSTIRDSKKMTSFAPNFDSVQATNAASTDSIVSGSASSSNDSKCPKRKTTSLYSSSSSSLASEKTKAEEPMEKKRRVPLFKKKLKIELNATSTTNSESKEAAKDCRNYANDNGENEHCHRQKKQGKSDGQITIQQLLSLAKARTLQAQSNLTLSQLKQQAREKTRANSKAFRQVRPKRKKRNGRYQKPKAKLQSPASTSSESETLEPVEKIVMNTGVLYLFRGDRRRAKFVRRK